jgi:hypothetical protein
MGLFTRRKKTPEEIQAETQKAEQELKEQVDLLNEKYKPYINLLHLWGDEVFIFKGFFAKDGAVRISFIKPETPEGFVTSQEYYWFKAGYEQTPEQTRINFLKFQRSLRQLGFEIAPIKKD